MLQFRIQTRLTLPKVIFDPRTRDNGRKKMKKNYAHTYLNSLLGLAITFTQFFRSIALKFDIPDLDLRSDFYANFNL